MKKKPKIRKKRLDATKVEKRAITQMNVMRSRQ